MRLITNKYIWIKDCKREKEKESTGAKELLSKGKRTTHGKEAIDKLLRARLTTLLSNKGEMIGKEKQKYKSNGKVESSNKSCKATNT